MTLDEELSYILYKETQREINNQIIQRLRDSSYEMQMSPMTFANKEDEEEYLKSLPAQEEYWNSLREKYIVKYGEDYN